MGNRIGMGSGQTKRGPRETTPDRKREEKRDGKLYIRMEERQEQNPIFITQCG